jgi:hypothetical protein
MKCSSGQAWCLQTMWRHTSRRPNCCPADCCCACQCVRPVRKALPSKCLTSITTQLWILLPVPLALVASRAPSSGSWDGESLGALRWEVACRQGDQSALQHWTLAELRGCAGSGLGLCNVKFSSHFSEQTTFLCKFSTFYPVLASSPCAGLHRRAHQRQLGRGNLGGHALGGGLPAGRPECAAAFDTG